LSLIFNPLKTLKKSSGKSYRAWSFCPQYQKMKKKIVHLCAYNFFCKNLFATQH
jgi:hypothetical protein